MSLKEKVLVVNLNISQWTARKYDAKVSREVEVNHNANDAGRFNKILIAAEHLKTIGKIANTARTFHYFNTLPWGDNGDRILPAQNYFPYISEMSKIKAEFEGLVDEFIAKYPDLKEDAVSRLGTMFNEGDYPPTGFIKDKFAIRFSFMPVPDSDDLRITIEQEELDKIKADIQGELNGRVENSVNELIKRIKEAVGHMADKLSEPKGIFRDSLVTNVCELVDVIPLLNFTGDKHITELVDKLKTLCVDAEQLRVNEFFRKEIADKAAMLLNYI